MRRTSPTLLQLSPLIGLLIVFAAGCSEDTSSTGLQCGPGTVERNGVCELVDDASDDDVRRRPGSDAGSDTGTADQGNDPGTDASTDPVADAESDADAGPRDDGTCTVDSEIIGWWDGTWTGRVFGSNPMVGGEFDQPASGTLTFEIVCESTELLIEGRMTGTANETFPFEGGLIGELDTETSSVDMDLVDASIDMRVIVVQFEAVVTGDLVGTTFENGIWRGQSASPTGVEGEGTWEASR